MTPGEALAFTFAATRTYPSHLQINGEDVPDSDEGCTYIVPENTEGLLVTEVRNTDIYVAKDGSDTNPGTVARPKLTLKGGLDVARSGDTVHVGPGDYNTLTMTPTPAPSVACRAWVRSGVTLVSTDGAAVTRILGESSIAADNVSGCGAGAVHGVKLEANATIGGFTIANGRGAYAKDAGGNLIAKTEDFGGNVYAADNTARICDCIISNGCAVIAGGGQYGSYYRCRFLDNSTIGNTAAARSANLYGCFVSGSAGTWCTDLIADCQQCTFGENSAAGSNGDLYRYGGATVANTIFTGGVIYSMDGLQVVNCVFKDGAVLKPNGEKTCKTPGCQFDVVAADLQFEADGLTPIVGRNVAVDKGNKDVFVAELGETDLNGNARFQNGLKLDIGAAEGDWRATYAAKLGRRIEVTAADPSVELGDDGVRLPAGAKLALAWKTGIDTTCAFQAVLDGDALAVAKDGVPWKTLDASGEQKFVTSGSVTELSFEMGANGESLLSRFHREIGMSLTVR